MHSYTLDVYNWQIFNYYFVRFKNVLFIFFRHMQFVGINYFKLTSFYRTFNKYFSINVSHWIFSHLRQRKISISFYNF